MLRDKAGQVPGIIPIIYNVGIFIMIHQEGGKGIAIGFLDQKAGRAVCDIGIVNAGKGIVPP